MKLHSNYSLSGKLSETGTPIASTVGWEKLSTYKPSLKYQPSTWVKLFNPPTAFSFDEAFLLCEYSEDKWLAWIPDYGQILLGLDEFC
jgi:hypothetical protein